MDKGCDICQEHFSTLSSYQTHLASTTHRLKVERAEIEERGGPKAYYGIAQSNVGYQVHILISHATPVSYGPNFGDNLSSKISILFPTK